MGLDVGVVNITYLDRPGEPVYDFLWALAEGRIHKDWGRCWAGNALVEFEKDSLVERATGWALKKGFGQEGQAALSRWIEGLPWQGDTIMLHLNW